MGKRPAIVLHTTLYGVGSGVCLAVGVYALFGVVTALLSYEDERLMTNLRLWVPLCVSCLGLGSWLGYRTLRRALGGIRQ